MSEKDILEKYNDKLSPMMKHYLETKVKYNDSILFYRLGDFYEMFFDDAVNVSRELELVEYHSMQQKHILQNLLKMVIRLLYVNN